MTTFIALFRGINVGGNRKLPMAELRACAAATGFGNPRTFIASGNLLVEADGDAATVEARIEAAVLAEMALAVEVIAREAAAWGALIAANPLPDAARERPKLHHLALSKHPLHAGAADALASRCDAGERVVQAGGALWIDYADGVARTKLTPAAIDRAAGSTVTTRNWNSVVALGRMAGC